jgi:hypothetical protein
VSGLIQREGVAVAASVVGGLGERAMVAHRGGVANGGVPEGGGGTEEAAGAGAVLFEVVGEAMGRFACV